MATTPTERAILAILKAEGITGPLIPIALDLLKRQYESGEALGSDILGPFTPVLNPVGTLVAEAGKEKRKRSRKQKNQDKKKSKAWAQANSEGRKNNGDLRAGWTQKRIATRANKILKKL